MRRLAIMAVLAAVGCGGQSTEPVAKKPVASKARIAEWERDMDAIERLKPGSKVVIYAGERHPSELTVPIFLDLGAMENVPVGTHGEVVSITEVDSNGFRDVIVKMTDGPMAGTAAKVMPSFLRAAE